MVLQTRKGRKPMNFKLRAPLKKSFWLISAATWAIRLVNSFKMRKKILRNGLWMIFYVIKIFSTRQNKIFCARLDTFCISYETINGGDGFLDPDYIFPSCSPIRMSVKDLKYRISLFQDQSAEQIGII